MIDELDELLPDSYYTCGLYVDNDKAAFDSDDNLRKLQTTVNYCRTWKRVPVLLVYGTPSLFSLILLKHIGFYLIGVSTQENLGIPTVSGTFEDWFTSIESTFIVSLDEDVMDKFDDEQGVVLVQLAATLDKSQPGLVRKESPIKVLRSLPKQARDKTPIKTTLPKQGKPIPEPTLPLEVPDDLLDDDTEIQHPILNEEV